MAQHPKSGGTGDGRPKTLLCAEWEALLVDALDGTLSAKDAAAFEAHRDTCLACARLLEDTRRGSEWLHFLQAEPEIPSDLVARILAQTSGAIEAAPLQPAYAGVPAVVVQTGWLPGLERHAVQSRWMMTAAMAFFSIAFTLNLTGVKLSGFRLSDLKPTALASSITRQFYQADAHVMRYYDNLRFVYELESRVRQMKQDVVPGNSSSGSSNPDQSRPAEKPAQPQLKKPNDGSAQKNIPEPSTPPVSRRTGEPEMASYPAPCRSGVKTSDFKLEELCSNSKKSSITNDESTKIDRAERSLA
jgi:hypothetical protein